MNGAGLAYCLMKALVLSILGGCGFITPVMMKQGGEKILTTTIGVSDSVGTMLACQFGAYSSGGKYYVLYKFPPVFAEAEKRKGIKD
jgi:hypothetical protein